MRVLRSRRPSRGGTRRGLSALAAASVAVSLMVASAPAQAAAPKTSHLRTAVTPATVLTGGKFVVSGAVSPAVAGKPVYLQRLVKGKWRTLTHKGVGKKGVYSFGVRAKGKPAVWDLRVIRPASAKAKGVIGKRFKVRLTKTAFKVTANAVTKVNAGEPVVLGGMVSPKATGKVSVQVLNGGHWTVLASTTLKSSAYVFSKLLPPKTYRLRVVKPFTAKIAEGTSKAVDVTVYPPAGVVVRPTVSAKLSLSSQDDATLGLSNSRLVFSTVKAAATPAKVFTFTNTGNAPATVSGLAIQGPDASSFALAPGQPTALTVPAGGTATVSVVFTPTATTNCPTGTTYPAAYNIGNSVRLAALVFTTTDVGLPGGSAVVGGLNSCNYGGNNEPVLDQVLSVLGYTDVVTGPKTNRRYIGKASNSPIPGTDEVSAPYFRAADPAAPVSVVPLAHYSTTATKPYQATGWYAQGAAVGPDGTCNASCHPIWTFPGEGTAPDTSFLQNQRLLPVPVGVETFTATGPFGLYNGEAENVNFSDDSLNVAHVYTCPTPTSCTDKPDLVPTQYLHNLRVYPAYGVGHVAIPNTYLVAIDVSRLADKNDDFQDVVLIVRNVVPVG